MNRSLDIHKLEDWSSNTGNVENADDDDCKMKGTEDDDPEICWFDKLGSGNMSCFECFYDDQQTKSLYILSGNPPGRLRLSVVKKEGVQILSERIGGHRAPILCGKWLSKIGCIVTGGE